MFELAGATVFRAIGWGMPRLRRDPIAREFNARMEGVLDERQRVARELHDTLLQTFQASLIQMQVARNMLIRRPEEAAQNLEHAISMAAGAIAEGRNAIQGLRCPSAEEEDVEELLMEMGQDSARRLESNGHQMRFRIVAEGPRQEVKPLVKLEVYQIARELLRNAFQHAEASQVEAEIRYERRRLCVHVRDNGKGIAPEVLKAGGHGGHWGLTGIHERAKQIGARLDLWTKRGAGTEVKLTVPASIAYPARVRGSGLQFLRQKWALLWATN